jgi:hypothetical protein
LRIAQVRLGLHNRGLCLTLLRRSLVELGDWRIAFSCELRSALQLLIGVCQTSPGGGELWDLRV